MPVEIDRIVYALVYAIAITSLIVLTKCNDPGPAQVPPGSGNMNDWR